jgi:LysM repeat protein
MRPIFAAVLLAVLATTGGLLMSGCRPSESLPFSTETDEPLFQRGKAMQRAGRTQEALDAFHKVIAKRGGDAPEAHFECGLIYLQHLKDPVAAIYHLRRYLAAQRPDAPQAARTRELIDTAMKEFARTLPAQPFEGQTKLLDLMDTVDQLTKENYQLKEEIARLRGVPMTSRPLPTLTPSRSVPRSAPAEEAAAEPVEPEAAPAVPVPPPTRSAYPANSATSNAAPRASPVNPGPAPAAGKVHVVQKGESLYSISRQYYGNGSRVNDIVAANSGLLQDRNTPLKIGMQLKLP